MGKLVRELGPFTLRENLGADGLSRLCVASRTGAGEATERVLLRVLSITRSEAERLWDQVKPGKALHAQLAGANLAHGVDVGLAEGAVYLAYAYTPGRPLTHLLDHCVERRAGLPVAEALSIVHRIARALAAFGGAQDGARTLAHGFVVPDLVWVTHEGDIELQGAEVGFALAGTSISVLPAVARYLSPERRRGEPLDPSDDVYSLSVLLAELLAGQRHSVVGAEARSEAFWSAVPKEFRSFLIENVASREERLYSIKVWKAQLVHLTAKAGIRSTGGLVSMGFVPPRSSAEGLDAPSWAANGPPPTARGPLPSSAVKPAARRAGWAMPAGLSLAAVVLVGGGWALLSSRGGTTLSPPATRSTASSDGPPVGEGSSIASSTPLGVSPPRIRAESAPAIATPPRQNETAAVETTVRSPTSEVPTSRSVDAPAATEIRADQRVEPASAPASSPSPVVLEGGVGMKPGSPVEPSRSSALPASSLRAEPAPSAPEAALGRDAPAETVASAPPANPSPPPESTDLESGVLDTEVPRLLRLPKLRDPRWVRDQTRRKMISVHVLVDADGHVRDVSLSTPQVMPAEVAKVITQAARGARFTAASSPGGRANTWVELSFDLGLN